MPSAELIVVRTIHFAALMALFGGFVFLLSLARPAFAASGVAPQERKRLHRRIWAMESWSLVAVVVSGAAWLGLQAAIVSGRPLAQALNGTVLAAVWNRTQFGEVWQVRLVLTVLLAALLWFGRRRYAPSGWLWFGVGGAVLSGGVAGSLAFAGHAVATEGTERIVHLTSDATHLLAAGAWLGALLPLHWVLQSVAAEAPETLAAAQRATARFSVLGITCVSALIVTGLINTWLLVGNIPALVGTLYGQLLLLKIALFLGMLCFAAINRTRLTPRLIAAATPAEAGEALRWLRRNALAETVLGLLVLAALATLGASTPAAHAEPIWPFPFDLSWQAARDDLMVRIGVFAAGVTLLIGLAIVVVAARRGRYAVSVAGALCIVVSLAVPMDLLAEPAFPTSYIHSPVRYTTVSIARGAPVFAENCAACHGEYGYGDGPAAASLTIKPANLTGVHLFHHGEGTLFWWVSKGIANSPMPPFEDVLSEPQRWDVLNFLRAQAEAEQGNVMTADTEAWRPVVAPDFAFQIGTGAQETLKEQRGRHYVLLVLVRGAEGEARLKQLEAAQSDLEKAGVRVIVVPLDAAAAGEDKTSPIVAETGPDVATAYSLYRRAPSLSGVAPMPDHLEFLIDRAGYLRYRWSPDFGGPGWAKLADLYQRVDTLNREPPRPPAPEGGAHHH